MRGSYQLGNLSPTIVSFSLVDLFSYLGYTPSISCMDIDAFLVSILVISIHLYTYILLGECKAFVGERNERKRQGRLRLRVARGRMRTDRGRLMTYKHTYIHTYKQNCH